MRDTEYCMKMKRIMLVVLVLMCLQPWVSPAIDVGASMDEVTQALGAPKGQMTMGEKTVWTYPSGTVEFEHGKVVEVRLKTPVDNMASASARNQCINNMRMIDQAKDGAALEHGLAIGDNVSEQQVSKYLENGFTGLVCPEGGRYTLNPVGKDPQCSVHGKLSQAMLISNPVPKERTQPPAPLAPPLDKASARNQCIDNLRTIYSAKERAAMAYGPYKKGDNVPEQQVSEFLKNGLKGLVCPEGGRYTLNPVGEDPECSVHGKLVRVSPKSNPVPEVRNQPSVRPPAATAPTALPPARKAGTAAESVNVYAKMPLNLVKSKAKEGDAQAQAILAFWYRRGFCGLEHEAANYREAEKWATLSAGQTNILGTCVLGLIIHDEKSGALLNEFASGLKGLAEDGDPYAQCCLAEMYLNGYSCPRDVSVAADWYRKAAEQGNMEGQYKLGYLYSEGKGVKKDYAEAAMWYKKAAEQGDSIAKRHYLFYEERARKQ
jgi:rRNA maturation protein Nop10